MSLLFCMIAVRGGCSVIRLTSQLETRWYQRISRILLRHHWSSASIFMCQAGCKTLITLWDRWQSCWKTNSPNPDMWLLAALNMFITSFCYSVNQSCSWWRVVCQFKEMNCRHGHRLWLGRERKFVEIRFETAFNTREKHVVKIIIIISLDVYVCLLVQQEIGWRGRSRKMLLYSTDAGFHYAGDGKVCLSFYLLFCVPYAAFHWARKLVFPNSYFRVWSRGHSQNSEYPTWKYDISDFNGTIVPTGKLVNTSFRAQWSAALVKLAAYCKPCYFHVH